jgi:hypothetical protein
VSEDFSGGMAIGAVLCLVVMTVAWAASCEPYTTKRGRDDGATRACVQMGYTGGHVDEKNWRVVCTTTATTVRSVELGAK